MIPNTRGRKGKGSFLWGKNYGHAYGIQAQGSKPFPQKESTHTKNWDLPLRDPFFSTYPLCAISILVFLSGYSSVIGTICMYVRACVLHLAYRTP